LSKVRNVAILSFYIKKVESNWITSDFILYSYRKKKPSINYSYHINKHILKASSKLENINQSFSCQERKNKPHTKHGRKQPSRMNPISLQYYIVKAYESKLSEGVFSDHLNCLFHYEVNKSTLFLLNGSNVAAG